MVKKNEDESKQIGKVCNQICNQKRRKLYEKPQLTEFGHIKKLTQGPSGTARDGTSTWKRA